MLRLVVPITPRDLDNDIHWALMYHFPYIYRLDKGHQE